MASIKITKGLQIQNREKINYHLTNWIKGIKYKENDNNPNKLDRPETEASSYNIGHNKYSDLSLTCFIWAGPYLEPFFTALVKVILGILSTYCMDE